MQVLEICALKLENGNIVIERPAGFALKFFHSKTFENEDIENFVYKNHRLYAGLKYNKSCFPMESNTNHFYYGHYDKEMNHGLLIITDSKTDLAERLMQIVKDMYANAKDIMAFNKQIEPIKKDAVKYIHQLDNPVEKRSWKEWLNPFHIGMRH